MKFAVIGGDLRQICLAEALMSDGYEVSTFALGKMAVSAAKTASEALSGAGCVILPLPAESGAGVLNAPLSDEQFRIRSVTDCVEKSATICAARPSAELREMLAGMGFDVEDYSQREEFAVLNAVATAEGALQTIMSELPVTVGGLKCLVVGYGRVGKVMADRLRGCGAEVSISARKSGDLAWIKAMGYGVENTGALSECVGKFDVLINTVPYRVFDRKCLGRVKKDALIIDLASKPGGVDMAAAMEFGVQVRWELGVPGRVAPKTSGIIIKDTVLNILRERGKT